MKVNDNFFTKINNIFISNNVDCVFLDYPINKDSNTRLIRIVTRDNKKTIKSILKNNNFTDVYFPLGKKYGYKFLYKTEEPLFFIKDNYMIEIWSQLCCKSFFQNAWLPLDKIINDNYMKNTKLCDNLKILEDDDCLIYQIADCFFTLGYFPKKQQDFINKNDFILKEKDFYNKMEKIFFKFSKILIECLLKKEYNRVFEEYKHFIEY